jgi:4-carboxymuconolactone decarboxylase
VNTLSPSRFGMLGKLQNLRKSPMRLPLMSPSTLNSEQRQLYDDMRTGIEANFKGFTAIDDSGRLIGPWNPWLRFSKFGGPVWELVKALSSSPKLPRPVREIAILVTGAHFHSAYEIYAHVLVAELRGIADDKIATIIAGQRPGDLTREEAVAYDLASALVSGGVLPALTYRQAVALFGEEGTAEFIYLVGLYCMVSVTLNGFDVPVPAIGETG